MSFVEPPRRPSLLQRLASESNRLAKVCPPYLWAVRLLAILSFPLLSLQAATADTPSDMPATISLAGSWLFQLDPGGRGEAEGWFKGSLKDTMRLPGTTDEQQKGIPNRHKEIKRLTRRNAYYGPAWYQREVIIPAAWQGKHITLFMERTKTTMVWVDAQRIGSLDSLAASQVYDLSAALTPGTHRLTVCVDNKRMPPIGDPHQISDQTQTSWNGIIGRIELKATDPVWIDDVQVYPDVPGRKIRLRLTFGKTRDIPVQGTLSLSGQRWNVPTPHSLSPARIPFQAKPDNTFETDFVMGEGMQLWDEFSPALYRLGIDFEQGSGGVVMKDHRDVDFGMRQFAAQGTQFAVNGKTIFLRGKQDACVFPLTGYPPMDVEGWVRVLKIAKSYGINHYRFHTWCPPEAAFQAADIVGIYMQPELPIWGAIGAPAKLNKGDVEQRADQGSMDERTAYLTAEGKRILRQFGNHASFVMLSLGNEMRGSREVMGRMVQEFRTFDGKRRLLSQGSNNFLSAPELAPGDDYWTTTMTGGHYNAGRYEPDVHGKLVRGSTPVHTTGHVNNTLDGTRCDYRQALQGIPVPVIGHEIGQYQVYPDYNEIKKYTGVLRARNLETFRDRLKTAGMLDQADDFFRASGALAVLCYREDIEAAWRTPGFGGFQLLDLQDFPGQGTALVGILDAFMDSKGLITPDEWRQFCCETVPLLRYGSYTWTDDQVFQADAEVANYGPAMLAKMSVRWSLVDSRGKELASGSLAAVDLPQGKLSPVGPLSISLHDVAAPQKLTVTLALPGTPYRNSYPLWIYPSKRAPVVPSGVKVAHTLDESVREELARGGKVLLIPEASALPKSIAGAFQTDFWCYPMFKRYNPPGTMGILCDPRHPALTQFPAEFHSDWQWWRLTKNARPMILDSLPRTLRPIVQVIDNFERNHKLGLVWEAQVGPGKLLVCSIDLLNQQAYPEVRQFYQGLLQYADSAQFHPETSVDIGDLKKLISSTDR